MTDNIFDVEMDEPVGQLQFGEIKIIDAFIGIMTYDVDDVKGWQQYDQEYEPHQTALATPKNGRARQTSRVFQLQDFPIGVQFDTWVNDYPIWSDDWKMFEKSMATLHGLNPYETEEYTDQYGINRKRPTAKARADYKTLYETHMQALKNGQCFFAYEKPITRTYPKADGTTGNIRGTVVIKQFASLKECKAAHTEYNGSVPVPEGSKMDTPKVEALPLAQAIGFAETLTRQAIGSDNKVDLDKLTASFQAMPMLAELKVDLPEVQAIISKVEKESLPF
jgi:hypothetical protein